MKNRSRKLNNHFFLEKENRNRDTLRHQLVNESQLVCGSSREILEEYDRLLDWKPSVLFLPIAIGMRNCESRRPSLLATFVRRTLATPVALVLRTCAAPLSPRAFQALERNSESPDCCIQHTVSAKDCGRRRWARACSFSFPQGQGFE